MSAVVCGVQGSGKVGVRIQGAMSVVNLSKSEPHCWSASRKHVTIPRPTTRANPKASFGSCPPLWRRVGHNAHAMRSRSYRPLHGSYRYSAPCQSLCIAGLVEYHESGIRTTRLGGCCGAALFYRRRTRRAGVLVDYGRERWVGWRAVVHANHIGKYTIPSFV